MAFETPWQGTEQEARMLTSEWPRGKGKQRVGWALLSTSYECSQYFLLPTPLLTPTPTAPGWDQPCKTRAFGNTPGKNDSVLSSYSVTGPLREGSSSTMSTGFTANHAAPHSSSGLLHVCVP